MFQIPRPGFGAIHPHDDAAHEKWLSDVAGHVTEGWFCDLDTGLFRLGEIARIRHALSDGLCGLLDLLKAYHPSDHKTVLTILEQATEKVRPQAARRKAKPTADETPET